MWNDVIDLRDFYASPLGQVARRMIRRQVRGAWSNVGGMNILGIGYAPPFLSALRGEAERTIAAMPARQGVMHWPEDASGLTLLADEADLPFPDLFFDRVIMVHALECSDQVTPMMREIWRVMSGNGRLLVVAPNRTGLWARFERTPFGRGRPYSAAQLSRLLRESMFTPLRGLPALFVPPSRSRMLLSSAPAWENIGARWFPAMSGIVMMEATKQIYAAPPGVLGRKKAYLPAQSPGGGSSQG